MKFFILDASDESIKTAPILQKKFDAQEREDYIDFTADNSFANLSLADLSETAWLGHADTKKIGDFSATAFAKKFEEEFLKMPAMKGKDEDDIKAAKKMVGRFCVIGCEAALQKSGDKSTLVQEMANALHKKGFTEVSVHAISNRSKQAAGMRVKVITSEKLPGLFPGDVIGYVLSADQEKAIEMQKEIIAGIDTEQAKVHEARRKAKQQKYITRTKKYITRTKKDYKEMVKGYGEENLRTQDEIHEDRAFQQKRNKALAEINRIELEAMRDNSVIRTNDIDTYLDEKENISYPTKKEFTDEERIKQAALLAINKLIKEQNDKEKEKDSKFLKKLKRAIRKDKTDAWPDLIEACRRKNFSGVFTTGGEALKNLYIAAQNALKDQLTDKRAKKKKPSSFDLLQMANDLLEDQAHKKQVYENQKREAEEQRKKEQAEKKLEQEKKKEGRKETKKEKSKSGKSKNLFEKIGDKVAGVIPEGVKQKAKDLTEEIGKGTAAVKEVIIEKPELEMPKDMEEALAQIQALRRIEHQEILARENFHLTKFYPSAKQVKARTLFKLYMDIEKVWSNDKKKPVDREVWHQLIRDAIANDKKAKGKDKGLMAHRMRSNRVGNLFTNILNGHPSRGILKPLKDLSRNEEVPEDKKWDGEKEANRVEAQTPFRRRWR